MVYLLPWYKGKLELLENIHTGDILLFEKEGFIKALLIITKLASKYFNIYFIDLDKEIIFYGECLQFYNSYHTKEGFSKEIYNYEKNHKALDKSNTLTRMDIFMGNYLNELAYKSEQNLVYSVDKFRISIWYDMLRIVNTFPGL